MILQGTHLKSEVLFLQLMYNLHKILQLIRHLWIH